MSKKVNVGQFAAYLSGTADVAKSAIDSVLSECIQNINSLVMENNKLKEELEEFKKTDTVKDDS
jgi:regulator of replication initiation timing